MCKSDVFEIELDEKLRKLMSVPNSISSELDTLIKEALKNYKLLFEYSSHNA